MSRAVAYLMTWTESERGWGKRPDGHSLHLSHADYLAYVQKYNDSLPDEVPDEYSYPDATLQAVSVDDPELMDQLTEAKNLRFYSGLHFGMSETGGRYVMRTEYKNASR